MGAWASTAAVEAKTVAGQPSSARIGTARVKADEKASSKVIASSPPRCRRRANSPKQTAVYPIADSRCMWEANRAIGIASGLSQSSESAWYASARDGRRVNVQRRPSRAASDLTPPYFPRGRGRKRIPCPVRRKAVHDDVPHDHVRRRAGEARRGMGRPRSRSGTTLSLLHARLAARLVGPSRRETPDARRVRLRRGWPPRRSDSARD